MCHQRRTACRIATRDSGRAELAIASKRSIARDWYHLHDSLALPANDPCHLHFEEFALCMTLVRFTGNDGWAREWKRPYMRHAFLAKRLGRSISRAAHLVAAMQKRRVIQARGNVTAAGKSSGDAAEYCILPREKWLARNVVMKERPRIPALRMRVRDGSLRVSIPGKGIAELAGEPQIRIGTAERVAVTVTGASGLGSLQIPDGARVDVAEGIPLLPVAEGRQRSKGAKNATYAAGSIGHQGNAAEPMLPVAEAGAISEESAQSVPPLPMSPVAYPPQNSVVVSCAGGHLKVWFPVGRRLTTESERRELPAMTMAQAVELFSAKGFRAIACTAPTPQRIASARRRSICLDGPATGTWQKLLERLKQSVNPHTFATWFGVTREVGTRAGKIVVLVPAGIFAKRMSDKFARLISTGLAEIGARGAAIEYRLREELDDIPAAPLAGIAHSQSQRKSA